MRVVQLAPAMGGPFPCIILYSEIFQLTGPIRRSASMLAGQGFVVLMPEVYYQHLPAGTVLAYDEEGKNAGNQLKLETPLENYDVGVEAMVQYAKSTAICSGSMGSIGFCLGGHLAFRAAMHPAVTATACFYATDIHSNTLGIPGQCDTFQKIPSIHGDLMMVWGRQDPHVPQEGRWKIYQELVQRNIAFTWHEFNAVHAFMRDEGERYNPSLAHTCYAMVRDFFNEKLKS
jgi:carboxymethylenebutenolidase